MADAPVTLTPENVTEHITSEDQLRELEDVLSGTPASPPTPESQEPPPEATPPEPEPPQPEGQPEFSVSDEEKEFVRQLREFKELSETPFKSPVDLVRGYKSLQGEYTPLRQKMKAFEPILNRMERDPQFKGYVEQLQAMVDNPALAQAYAAKMGGEDVEPDPLQYDLSDPEQYKKFKSEHTAWTQRQVNSVINARLGQVEQQARMGGFKAQFQAKFPDVADPDTLLEWASQNVPNLNPYEAAYRLREWDNSRAKITEDVRKEFAKKVEEASKNKTPQGAAPAKGVTITEVLEHLARYGQDASEKRYGKDLVIKALRELT